MTSTITKKELNKVLADHFHAIPSSKNFTDHITSIMYRAFPPEPREVYLCPSAIGSQYHGLTLCLDTTRDAIKFREVIE